MNMETDSSQDPVAAELVTHCTDPQIPQPAAHSSLDDSDQIVRSPIESIFSDDDDIWFEANDQLTSETVTYDAGPPLTSTKEEVPQQEPEGELLVQDGSEEPSPVAEEGSDGSIVYYDVATSAEDSDSSSVTQDTGATGHAQNTGNLVGTPQDIDTFVDVESQEIDTVKIEGENDFLAAQDLTAPSMNIDGTDASRVNQDTNAYVTTQDIDSDALNTQQDNDSLIQTQDATDAPMNGPTINPLIETQECDTSAVSHDINALTNVHASAEDDNSFKEAKIHDIDSATSDQKVNPSLATREDTDASLVSQDLAMSVSSYRSEVLLAEEMVKELRKQQKMAEACKAETRYVEACTAAMTAAASSGWSVLSEGDGQPISIEIDGMGIGPVIELPVEHDGMGPRLDEILPDDTSPPVTPEEKSVEERHREEEEDIDISVATHNVEIYLAESLIRELKTKQKMAESSQAETRYVEVCTSALMADKEPVTSKSFKPEQVITEESDSARAEIKRVGVEMKISSEATAAMDLESTEHVQKNVELDVNADDDLQIFETPQQLESISALLAAPKVTCDTSTNTERVGTYSQATNTSTPEFSTQAINTDPSPVAKEIGCNTMLNCFDVLQRAKEMEELQFLKVEHRIAVTQMNEAKSQKMVAEQLTKIVQSDLAELRQQNLTETTRRLQLENDLSDAKIELSHTASQLKENEERVQELEESLSGTSLLVRKLEEQNAVSLMSRGGIDYMLQAKLAEGRAQEAEQKLEVIQSELLQAQSEVRRLLDRVAEASRDRSEMVSSQVHTQLIQIADERAQAAERKSLELERQVQDLRGKLSVYEAGGGIGGGQLTNSSGLTGLTSLSGLSGLSGSYSTSFGLGSTSSGLGSASSGLGSTYSPFSYTSATTKSLSLAEQYNIHSDLAPPTFSSSATPTSFTSPFLEGVSNGNSSKQLGRSTIYSNSDISGINRTTGGVSSSILKPSQMFKKHGDGSHDLTMNGSHAQQSHVISSEGPDGGNIELPTFETTPSKPHPSPKVTFNERVETGEPGAVITGGDGDGNDSGSSDWSSSSDGEGEGGEAVGVGAMKPSHHTSLIAEWEWRTMADTSDTSSAHPSSPLTKRRVPPPVAPKPHGTVFKTSAQVAVYERIVQFEPSASFDVPTHSAAIQGLRRPRGPRGRSLPSRYHGQQHLVT